MPEMSTREELQRVRRELAAMCGAHFTRDEHERYGRLLARQALLEWYLAGVRDVDAAVGQDGPVADRPSARR